MRMTGPTPFGIKAIIAKSVKSGRNIKYEYELLDVDKSPK